MRALRGWGVACVAAWLAPDWAAAQVDLSARLQHSRVLQFEPVVATVRIENQSAGPITVGAGGEVQLHFDIWMRPGDLLPERADAVVPEAFTVEAGRSVSVVVNLTDRYSLTRLGPYTVRGRLAMGERMVSTSRLNLEVVPGLELQRVEATVDGGLHGPLRKCALLTLPRDGREHLFLRFDDPETSVCHGVHDLGTLIRYTPPVLAVDRLSHVHVLHQSAPTRYTHSVFRVDGAPVASSFYTKGPAAVRLETAQDGTLVVVGGQPYAGDVSVQMPRLPAVPSFE